MGDVELIDEGSVLMSSTEDTSPIFDGEMVITDAVEDGQLRKIKGWFGPLNKPNGNRYLYTENTMRRACEEAADRIRNGQVIGAIRHPSLFEGENPDQWCVRWDNVYVEDNKTYFEGTILDVPAGKLAVDLWDSGVKWCVSPRGSAVLEWIEPEDEEPYYLIQEYKLLSIDLTVNPAFVEQQVVMDSINNFRRDVIDSKAMADDKCDEVEGRSAAQEEEIAMGEKETMDNANVEAEEVTTENEELEELETEELETEAEATTDGEAAVSAAEEDVGEEEEDEEEEENASDELETEVVSSSASDGDTVVTDTNITDGADPPNDPAETAGEHVTDQEVRSSAAVKEDIMDKFDRKTQEILLASALSSYAESVVDGWIEEGKIDASFREQAVKTIKDSQSIDEAEENARRVLPLLQNLSTTIKTSGSGVVGDSSKDEFEDLPETIEEVIADSVQRVPEKYRNVWSTVIRNYAESNDPMYRNVLALHTRAGRKLLTDASYSNADLVYTNFVLPIVERLWMELKGADLVATFPVNSPAGIIPRLSFQSDSGSFQLEDYAYGYFDHTEGTDKKEAKLTMSSQTYSVKSKAIAFEWSDDLAFDLNKLYGRNAEDILIAATSRRLSNEIDMDIIDTIIAAANASTSVVNFGTQPPGTTTNDIWWSKGFQAHLTALETTIYQNSNTHPNFILTGQNGYEMLMMQDTLTTRDRDVENNTASTGVSYVGTFAKRFDIYYTTYMPADVMIMGHKPAELATAGVVFLPYVPATLTERAANPIQNTLERAIYSRYALERLNDEVYGVMHVWNSVGTWPF